MFRIFLILGLMWLLMLRVTHSVGDNDKRLCFIEEKLISPKELPPSKPGVLDVAMILLNVNTNRTEQKTDKLISHFTRMIDSIFLYSQGTPLRLIFLTDEPSKEVIGELLMNRAGKYLSETVLKTPAVTGHDMILMFPKISVSYIRTSEIFNNRKKGIHQLRNYFGKVSNDGMPYMETPWKLSEGFSAISWNYKYLHDLFYILPYHHLELPETINKLIVIDVDLEFTIDIVDLFRQFKKFGPTEVIGCGVTQSPYYFTFFKSYRKIQPETNIGKPGRYQGLNTGVLLLDLERMRASSLYQKTTEPETVTEMKEKYQFSGTVGDQDWLTLISFEYPELIYILPCEYNKEEHRPGECHQDTVEEWEITNKEYHYCSKRIKIRHRSGSI